MTIPPDPPQPTPPQPTPWPPTPSQATPSQTTPSQTVGPFFAFGLPYPDGPRVVPEWRPDAITLHGHVLDGAGAPIPDALVEIWQPDAAGRIPRAVGALTRSLEFSGFGRCPTDASGHFWFSTLKPGAVDVGPAAGGAPHIAMLVFARGLLKPVATRVYFPANPANPTNPAAEPIAVPTNPAADSATNPAAEPTNDADPLLASLPPDRRDTLIAVPDAPNSYRFDVHLQGEQETVFLAL